MRKILLASVGLFALAAVSQPALAADLPVKAPVYKAPVYVPLNWTGFYVGANAGYSWGNWDNGAASTGSPVSTASPNVKGWVGGLQAGYNWQIDRSWVVGLEGDIQITGEKASETGGGATTTDIAGTGNQTGFHTITTSTSANDWKFPWFGTFRGRIGALVDPSMLIYGTGGLAFGNFKFDSQATSVATTYRGAVGTTTDPTGTVTTLGVARSDSTTRLGWALGAGVEKKFSQNWSVKLEYLYLDFGTRTFFSGTGSDTSVRLRDNIVRVGLNYKLN
jgi:outer membrane immunogenic protein